MENNFTDIGISKELQEVLKKSGISTPTPIQVLTIPKIMAGKDISAKAQTGTGKTLAFMLPLFEKIDISKGYTQALIITPTRELAIQITEEAKKLTKYKDVGILAVYGGQDVKKQKQKLKKGLELIIATPGRLLDHIEQGTTDLSKIETLIIDEADEIINMGFFKDVGIIINKTPKSRQTLLFSATMPKKLANMVADVMKNPQSLVAKEDDILDEQIEEIMIHTTHRKKLDDLCHYLDENNPFMAIIFCRTKRRVNELTTNLIQRGYNVDELHGDLTQGKRERTMKKFRAMETQYLIATDVAARGLDIEGITHVFNYDEPEEDIKYTHRIGRTGRAGEKGIAVTFIVKE
ncbi:MAG TPA: DEAD/DEAH box helicase [Epulopiscium sp.]|nr:DEAD/DEAH box helicase [Candidatus Epulonipiscium sp.]